jgi:hypothetical protein
MSAVENDPVMNKKALIGLLILLVGVAGYFAYDYQARHSEAELLRRATLYWESIRINDLETAYLLEAEAEAGLLQPHEVAVSQDWGRRLLGFKLGAVTYVKNHAEIELTREITLPDSTKTKTYAGKKDLWTFTNGHWFHGEPEAGTSSMRRPPEPPPRKIY